MSPLEEFNQLLAEHRETYPKEAVFDDMYAWDFEMAKLRLLRPLALTREYLYELDEFLLEQFDALSGEMKNLIVHMHKKCKDLEAFKESYETWMGDRPY